MPFIATTNKYNTKFTKASIRIFRNNKTTKTNFNQWGNKSSGQMKNSII